MEDYGKYRGPRFCEMETCGTRPTTGFHRRVSVDRDDPGYPLYRKYREEGFYCSIYLDGVEQSNRCIMADEGTGEVTRYLLDESGQFLRLQETVATETVRGKVRIELVTK